MSSHRGHWTWIGVGTITWNRSMRRLLQRLDRGIDDDTRDDPSIQGNRENTTCLGQGFSTRIRPTRCFRLNQVGHPPSARIPPRRTDTGDDRLVGQSIARESRSSGRKTCTMEERAEAADSPLHHWMGEIPPVDRGLLAQELKGRGLGSQSFGQDSHNRICRPHRDLRLAIGDSRNQQRPNTPADQCYWHLDCVRRKKAPFANMGLFRPLASRGHPKAWLHRVRAGPHFAVPRCDRTRNRSR
jgi:hypothetical protein